jgi:hypothetical protein
MKRRLKGCKAPINREYSEKCVISFFAIKLIRKKSPATDTVFPALKPPHRLRKTKKLPVAA